MSRDELLTECAMTVKPQVWGYSRQMDYRGHSFGWIEYTQRRAELINEPDDSEAPEGAQWKCQDANGGWSFWHSKPSVFEDDDADENGWCGAVGAPCANYNIKNEDRLKGAIPAGHDWRKTLKEVNQEMNKNTLQYNPEDVAFKRELNPTSSSIADSQAREAAEITQQCRDGVRCGFGGIYCDDCPNSPHEADARKLDAQLDSDIKAFQEAYKMVQDHDAAEFDGQPDAHYSHMYKGIKLDPYRIAKIYNMQGGPREQIMKKTLRFTDKGQTEQQVVDEIRSALNRWQSMLDEDSVV